MCLNRKVEFVVIVKLSDEHVKKLNKGNSNGVCLDVRCDKHNFRELNRNESIHESINSRVFYVQDVGAGTKCQILLLDKTDGNEEIIACKEFKIPSSQEYCIIEI